MFARSSCCLPSFTGNQPHKEMNQVEARKRDEKHEPAGKLMKEANRLIRIPILHTESRSKNAQRIGSHGDGYAGERQDRAAQGCPF